VLITNLLALLQQHRVDYTRFFRSLSYAAKDTDEVSIENVRGGDSRAAFGAWLDNYRQRAALETLRPNERVQMMLAHNPKYILRRHLLENVITQAEQAQDFTPLNDLVSVLQSPYAEHETHTQLV
jgi:uncharacterized protein YdiU (UPF0061 family)